MFVIRKLFKIMLLPVFFLLLLLKAMIVTFENLSSVVMIMMAGMFAVTIIEGMCDSFIEKISDL